LHIKDVFILSGMSYRIISIPMSCENNSIKLQLAVQKHIK